MKHSKNAILGWVVETMGPVVDAELEALPADMRARFVHIVSLIETFGLYVTAKPKRVVVARVFVKKTQKTPGAELKMALRRAKAVLND